MAPKLSDIVDTKTRRSLRDLAARIEAQQVGKFKKLRSEINQLVHGLWFPSPGQDPPEVDHILNVIADLENLIPSEPRFEVSRNPIADQRARSSPIVHVQQVAFESEWAQLRTRIAVQRRIVDKLREVVRFGPAPDVDPDVTPSALNWVILPPGPHPFQRIKAYFQAVRPEDMHRFDAARVKAMLGLAPTKIYRGLASFKGYLVFTFVSTESVILECPIVGNAIYVISENWQQLSRHTKRELLHQHRREVERIVHQGEWLERVKAIF